MSSNKNVFGGGDTGGDVPMSPSEDDGRSVASSSRSTSLRPGHGGSGSGRMVEPVLKEPWVPAPGKSSKLRSRSISSVSAASAKVVPSDTVVLPVPVEGGGGVQSTGNIPRKRRVSKQVKRKGRSPTKRSRSIGDRKMSGYKLQSKDSLIDVTASLTKRRDEVFKLWEQNVMNSDTVLLTELENANKLAVDAASDVSTLRQTIENLKKKTGKLALEDSQALDGLRRRILSKLQLFEQSHAHIQKNLKSSRSSSQNPKSGSVEPSPRPSAQSVVTPIEDPVNTKSEDEELSDRSSSIVYLKTIAESYSEAETENEAELEDYEEPAGEPGDRESNPPKPLSRGSCYSGMNPTMMIDSIYYRDKIRGLNRKMMRQEGKRAEMKRDMKRIESRNDYEIKYLKATMKQQMDEIGHLPQLLDLTETKLNDSVHAKFAIESKLQAKDAEVTMMKQEMKRLEKEVEVTSAKLDSADAKNETLAEKLERLELENRNLRMEILNTTKPVTMESQEETHAQKFLFLEDKISELETELETANKKVLAVKRVKQEVTTELNRRIEELMEILEITRTKNRDLTTHIHMIKTKYYEIFNTEGNYGQVFPEMSKVIEESKGKSGHWWDVHRGMNEKEPG